MPKPIIGVMESQANSLIPGIFKSADAPRAEDEQSLGRNGQRLAEWYATEQKDI